MDSMHAMPKSRSENLVVQQLADETLIYDLDRHKVHCLNSTSAYVWRHCDGTTPVNDVAAGLASEFGVPADKGLVMLALKDLNKVRLLDGFEAGQLTGFGLDRRKALIKIGVAALVPAIASIIAPTAALAVTNCRTLGQTCSPTQLCCDGLICVNGLCRTIGT